MGANATTFVPSYTAGEVLTAANLSVTNSGVPVFATTVTRDAAFGGTGEKTLAEGQFAYIEASNTTQYYDGSAWQTVGASGLVCLKNETAFSASSQIICDNVFSSAYTFYKIVIRCTQTTGGSLALQLRVGGVAAATNYNQQTLISQVTTISGARNTGQTRFVLGDGSNGSFFCSADVLLSGPALADATTFQCNYQHSNGGYTVPVIDLRYGNHSTATAYDGFELIPGSGTITGVYSVYGYSEVAA